MFLYAVPRRLPWLVRELPNNSQLNLKPPRPKKNAMGFGRVLHQRLQPLGAVGLGVVQEFVRSPVGDVLQHDHQVRPTDPAQAARQDIAQLYL
jgi:hypothetical protein